MIRITLAAGALAAAALCCAAGQARAQARNPTVLTREELVATGRPTLHEAVRALRSNWVRYRARFPHVYVDQVRAEDEAVLQRLRPEEALWVQYSTPAEARVRFDRLNSSGVIHVSTRLPLTAAHPPAVARPEFQSSPGVSLSVFNVGGVSNGNRFQSMEGTGLAVGASLPVARGTTLVGSVQLGELAGCVCWPHVRYEREASFVTVEAGLKMRGNLSADFAPFVAVFGGVSQVAMDEKSSVAGSTFAGSGTERGVTASLAAGVDLRLGSRVMLTPEARLSTIDSRNWITGRLGSLHLGTTILLGR